MKFIKFGHQTHKGPVYEYVALSLFKYFSYIPEDNSFYAKYFDQEISKEVDRVNGVDGINIEDFDEFLNSKEDSEMKVFPIYFIEKG